MSFRKPEEDDEGQTFEQEQSPDDGSASITEERVKFGDEEVTVADALRLAGDMLMEPEEFGLATTERVRELEKENEELRADLEDHRAAIAELAEAVEAIASNQADMAGMDEVSSVLLERNNLGDIYQPQYSK